MIIETTHLCSIYKSFDQILDFTTLNTRIRSSEIIPVIASLTLIFKSKLSSFAAFDSSGSDDLDCHWFVVCSPVESVIN